MYGNKPLASIRLDSSNVLHPHSFNPVETKDELRLRRTDFLFLKFLDFEKNLEKETFYCLGN